jgi:transposase
MRPRTLRRWRWRYEQEGYDGLFDRRRRLPSPRRVPLKQLEGVLRLYRERYAGFNVRHFVEIARRKHGVELSYSFIKAALQGAGLVAKHRARGKHRKRRERKPCFGQMLHIDGSPHPWLALVPDERQSLITVMDDATSKILYSQLWPTETSLAVLTALAEVISTHGIPASLYSDRASWGVFTPKAGLKPDRTKLTEVGKALKKLGIEHIVSYSPQARGRSERTNRTLQGRVVNELRIAGIRTIRAANRYLREQFIPGHNERFTCEPADPHSAFVALGKVDLEQILCFEVQRCVGQDNTVVYDHVHLQIPKQPGRRSCAGLELTVRRHLDGGYSAWLGPRRVGLYDKHGRPILREADARAA